MEKNEFAALLYKLIRQSGVKNVNVSQALGYDLSYISKWLSGKMLPSERNIPQISNDIAKCIVETLDDDKKERFQEEYGYKNEEYLCKEIAKALSDAYYRSKKQETNQSIREVNFQFYAEMSLKKMVSILRSELIKKSADVVAFIDVFSLNQEIRLLLAGIKEGSFTIIESMPDVHLNLAFNIDISESDINRDYLYDCLYLIHIVSGYSIIDFNIYRCSSAYGKFLYSIKNQIAVCGMLTQNEKECMAVSFIRDSMVANQLYQKLFLQLDQGAIVFRKVTMKHFAMGYEKLYVQSLISSGCRWLVGHVTELILPDDLFEEFLDELEGYDRELLRKIHMFSRGALVRSNTKVLIYETIFSELIAGNYIDFFGKKIKLEQEQIIAFLDYIISLICREGELNIRLVSVGFSTDFIHLPNPCLFMAELLSYLRLEKTYNKENVLIISDKETRKLFDYFYEKVWSEREDVVISNSVKIKDRILHYKKSILLLLSQ